MEKFLVQKRFMIYLALFCIKAFFSFGVMQPLLNIFTFLAKKQIIVSDYKKFVELYEALHYCKIHFGNFRRTEGFDYPGHKLFVSKKSGNRRNSKN